MGFSINLQKISIKTPLLLNLSGSMNFLTSSESPPSPFPVPNDLWTFDNAGVKGEFSWSPSNLQFRTGAGYANKIKNDENQEKWEFHISASARFKYGRLSLKAASEDFPEKWNWTVSWRLEKR
jgi:hypothetical protein